MSLLVVLPSIHDVLRLEKRLREEGVPTDLVPKPTALSTDCGIVLDCEPQDLPRVRAALAALSQEGRVYREEGPDRYEEVN